MSAEALPPLVVEFEKGSRYTDPVVRFKDGEEVVLPSEQVVMDEISGGLTRVGFGGMSFEGIEDGKLVFWRVKDVLPEERLESEGDWKLTVRTERVRRVLVQGSIAWPKP